MNNLKSKVPPLKSSASKDAESLGSRNSFHNNNNDSYSKSPSPQFNTNLNEKFIIKAMYLGCEPMGELLDGENGSDAIQVPLKRTILRTEGHGEQVELSMTIDSLLVRLIKSIYFFSFFFPKLELNEIKLK
jgi:hypothetical protein